MNDGRKKRLVGTLALMILSIHILICVICIFIPDKVIPRNPVTTVYRNLILLGPFFTESRILDSHYLSFRYKNEDLWSGIRHLNRKHFEAYSAGPWRVDQLLAINYERYLLHSLQESTKGNSFRELSTTKSFRELNSFLLNEMINSTVDSVQITYTTDRYLPHVKSFATDTLFTFIYNPNSIASVKK